MNIKETGCECGLDSSGPAHRTVPYERCNDTSSLTKGEALFDQLSDYQLPKEVSVPFQVL